MGLYGRYGPLCSVTFASAIVALACLSAGADACSSVISLLTGGGRGVCPSMVIGVTACDCGSCVAKPVAGEICAEGVAGDISISS